MQRDDAEMNEEQLALLKQGAEEWNQWRKQHPDTPIDLRSAKLPFADLSSANLAGANLADANLASANFGVAAAFYDGSVQAKAILSGATLIGATLGFARLVQTDCRDADFQEVSFFMASLLECDLSNADMTDASFGRTTLSAIDLRNVQGLEDVKHLAPSHLDLATLRLSEGAIPDVFLRGCGLSDSEILMARLYDPKISENEINDMLYEIAKLRGRAPIQTHPVFISYAHEDATFIEILEHKLNDHGIRYWRDVHDLKAGRIETQIDRAMRLHPTVILVLSKNSVESDWVEWEADRARELEKEMARDVLCPVSLDDSWKVCRWAGPLRKQIEKYHVVDLSDPTDKQLAKVIDGLGLFYH